MSSLESIDNQLKSLKLSRKEIPKDGSCLFRCISESIFGTQNYHLQVRKQCIKYLELNRDLFEPFACIHNPWDKYILEMSKEGTWGGEVELQAISLIYEINFIIYIGGNNTTNVNNGFKNDILLAYCHGEHYDLVLSTTHYTLYNQLQSIVYEMVYKSIGKQYPLLGIPFKNISMKIWEENDKIKQIRDSKIVEKLLKSQSVNILDEYEINKKKPNKNNNNRNIKNSNEDGGVQIKGKRNNNCALATSNDSNGSNGVGGVVGNNNRGRGNKKSGVSSGSTKNFLLLSTDSDESNEKSPQLQSVQSPPISIDESDSLDQEVDEELKEIFRQIELQEIEEQRLIGLEKHFPTLPPNHNSTISSKLSKLESFESDLINLDCSDNNGGNGGVDDPAVSPPPPSQPVWGKPQNWQEIVNVAVAAQSISPPTSTTTTTTTSTVESNNQVVANENVEKVQSKNNYNNNNRNFNNNRNNNQNNYYKNNNNNYNNNNNNYNNRNRNNNNSNIPAVVDNTNANDVDANVNVFNNNRNNNNNYYNKNNNNSEGGYNNRNNNSSNRGGPKNYNNNNNQTQE